MPEPDFELFLARHHRELRALAYRLVGDDGAADAEDLAGDTVLAAWRQWPRIRGVDNPLAYVRRVMRNLAVSRVRRRVRERQWLELCRNTVPDGPDPVAVVSVRDALARLPPGRRACVLLRFGFDLSEREVAALLGVGVGTVKSQASRGLVQLARVLGPQAEPGEPAAGGTAARSLRPGSAAVDRWQ